MVFTINDLLQVSLIAILFVVMFKVQKVIAPQTYYAISSYILGSHVSIRMIIIRVFLLIAFGALISKFISAKSIIIFGTSLGAFLIIWPVFMNAELDIKGYYYLSLKDKVIYYLLLFLFVISSVLLVYLGFSLKPYALEFIKDFVKEWLLSFITAVILHGSVDYGGKYLDKKISIRSSETQSMEEDKYTG